MDYNKFYSLVIPMYNEEGNAGILIDRIRESMQDFQYELILIDDHSSDRTVREIKEKNDGAVVLIELKKNYGQSSAMMAGFDFATGDYIITLDGDLQNDPSDIPAMVDLLEGGDYDLVVGKRQKRQDSSVRTIPSRIANFIIKKSTKLNISDQGCALKVFTNETAKDLNLYGENHRFISLMAHLNGARIADAGKGINSNWTKTRTINLPAVVTGDASVINELDKKAASINFNTSPRLSGVDIVSALFGMGDDIIFRSDGSPSQGGTVVLLFRGRSKTITVESVTGRISVQ